MVVDGGVVVGWGCLECVAVAVAVVVVVAVDDDAVVVDVVVVAVVVIVSDEQETVIYDSHAKHDVEKFIYLGCFL